MKRRPLPVTERTNPRTHRIDRLPTRDVLELLHQENARVATAIRRVLPQISKAVDAIVEAWGQGRRLFYVGAGTSGRLGVLDAVECPPTFQVSTRRVQAILAGGNRAMFRSVEGAEDSPEDGARDLARKQVRTGDVVVVLSASGNTPYALGALRLANQRGARTIAVTVNPDSPAARQAKIAICPVTGPEAIAGSTRLKAGTAQKVVLNLLSTAAFIRLGHVYRNLMVNVQMSNRKLRQRGRRVLQEVLGCSLQQAEQLIRQSDGNLKVALVIGRLGCSRREAEQRLALFNGHVARALAEK